MGAGGGPEHCYQLTYKTKEQSGYGPRDGTLLYNPKHVVETFSSQDDVVKFVIKKGFNTVLMKPAIDTRTIDKISTRLGIEQECVSISGKPSYYILQSINDRPDYILVDEAQFFSEDQVWDLANLVDNWDIKMNIVMV